jgi:hypothetical protein
MGDKIFLYLTYSYCIFVIFKFFVAQRAFLKRLGGIMVSRVRYQVHNEGTVDKVF